MTPLTWPCPLPGGGIAQEYALAWDQGRKHRLLIAPALFEEANRMRRLTVEVMRRLDAAGIDCFLPDYPGTNESPQPLETQAIDDWQDAMATAARQFAVTHVLGIRGGCLFTPAGLPTWRYAPLKGASILRQMVRARIIASREAGIEENRDSLIATAITKGLELGGYRLGGEFVGAFRTMEPADDGPVHTIAQDMLGGGGLWMRAEPGASSDQADALAAIVAIGIRA